MKILIVFPKYEALDMLEIGAVRRFLSFAEKLIDSCVAGRNTVFMLAENDTARRMKEDVPNAKFITFTNETLLGMLDLSPKFSDCDYTGEIKPLDNYSVRNIMPRITTVEQFEKFYTEVLEASYAASQEIFDLIIEFTMPKKYTHFKMKEIPKATIYYTYDIINSKPMVYLGGQPNEELTKQWKGGIPHEG